MYFSIAYYYITIPVSHQIQSLHKPLLNANRSKEERGSWDAPVRTQCYCKSLDLKHCRINMKKYSWKGMKQDMLLKYVFKISE